MQIPNKKSNRIEWPLGTGRSVMHDMRLDGSWLGSLHERRELALGNRGSATQGGARTHSGLLPFKSSCVQETVFGFIDRSFTRFFSGTSLTVNAPGRFVPKLSLAGWRAKAHLPASLS